MVSKNYTMVFIQFHVLLQILLLAALTKSTSATISLLNFTTAKPNCVDRCGDISVPYPFGTTANCYGDDNFLVTCNQSFDPPRLFMRNTSVEIADISLGGQLRVLQPAAKACYSENGTLTDHFDYSFGLPTYFTFNDTANTFKVLGCNTVGYISSTPTFGDAQRMTCGTTCRESEDLLDASCGGLGCCFNKITTKDVWRVQLDLQPSDPNRTSDTWRFSNCSYGVFGEEQGLAFSPRNLTSFDSAKMFPVIVDWAIGNETSCESAQSNSLTYACTSSKSDCYMPGNGYGYRCRCKAGYQGNPYLSDGCKDINECNDPKMNNCTHQCDNLPGSFKCFCPKGFDDDGDCKDSKPKTYKAVAGAAVGVAFVLLIIIVAYFVVKKQRLNKIKNMFFLQNGGTLLREKLSIERRNVSGDMTSETSSSQDMAKIFSSLELRNATKNFHKSMIVGQGGFGIVYKGLLPGNRTVAIKKPKEIDPTQIEQFINEVVVLSRIKHPNVVKLLGCCLETEVPLLVYEFIDNGTLHDHIHNPAKKHLLGWNLRLKIANETADVLSYLHSTASTLRIIHRDVKSANILLDNNFSAKVSDFGASRLVPMDQTQLSTIILGTAGYLDPEYMQTNQLTEKSDVYSFGVVLVELITGLKASSHDRPEEERYLANLFLCRLKERRLFEILDETIVFDGNQEHLTSIAMLAQMCLSVKAEGRPSMEQVAMELDGLRLGRRHSGARPQHNAEEIGSVSGDRFEGLSDVTDHVTAKHNASFSGGR